MRKMSEKEAIEALKLQGGLEITGKAVRVAKFFEGLVIAIQALEEIQQYRATGMTPEQIKEMQMDYCAKGAVLEEYKEIGTVKELARLRSDYERVLKYNDDQGKIIDRYEAIGTLDQCREAVERMKPKKPKNVEAMEDLAQTYFVECHCGGMNQTDIKHNHQVIYCWKCGQAIDNILE